MTRGKSVRRACAGRPGSFVLLSACTGSWQADRKRDSWHKRRQNSIGCSPTSYWTTNRRIRFVNYTTGSRHAASFLPFYFVALLLLCPKNNILLPIQMLPITILYYRYFFTGLHVFFLLFIYLFIIIEFNSQRVFTLCNRFYCYANVVVNRSRSIRWELSFV